MADEKKGVFGKIGSTIDSIGASSTKILGDEKNSKVVEKLHAGSKEPKSIAGMARKSIFEFPAFISTTVPLDYAEATCGLLELTYASYLQMAISQEPEYTMTNVGDPFAKWKTDTNNYLEVSDLTDTFDACYNVITEGDRSYTFELVSIPDRVAEVINEVCEYAPLSEFDHYFQEAPSSTPSTPDPDKEYFNAVDKAGKRKYYDDLGVRETTPGSGVYSNIENSPSYRDEKMKDAQARDSINRSMVTAREAQDDYDLRNEGIPSLDALNRYQMRDKLNGEDHETKIKQAELDLKKEKQPFEIREKLYASKVGAAEVLDESKVQKLNSLKPLIMKVEMRLRDDRPDGTGYKDTRELVCGVKIYSRLIEASTLPEVAKFPLEEMDKRTRNVRWKAGELKFFKDILFRIKEKKQTAIDSKDPNRKWYRRLYELAHMTGDSASVGKLTKNKSIVRKRLKWKFLGYLGDPVESNARGFLPNATIIISKADIDNINMEAGIDLLDPGKATSFCKELFLMNFVVIDLDAQTIKVLTPDLHKDFDVHTLASVNKQLAMIDTSSTTSREIFKVLNKS